MKQFDLLVIGSGPAGQKAAIQAAKAGQRVAVFEQLREVGGACVQFGTIPSKALREKTRRHAQAMQRLESLGVALPSLTVNVSGLIGEMDSVVKAHDVYMREQLLRNQVEIVHGRASFDNARMLNVRYVNGHTEQFSGRNILIATGSKPRHPDHIPVDHEFIYDSDSILSLAYLPQSMVVVGGGVIACEYASIFSTLGVQVTLIDRYPLPLGFLDGDLARGFLAAFERQGGVFIGDAEVVSAGFDGISAVTTEFADGTRLKSDKLLCALGRVSQVDGLKIANSGVVVSDSGLVIADADGRTNVEHIYAAGDVVGPPSLASASMEQGRRAACSIAGLPVGDSGDFIPSGIYAIPELASVGLTEAQAREQFEDIVVGYAQFSEIARGHIAGIPDGMLKMIADDRGRLLGVHILGADATDLIHIGQMALIHRASIEVFVDNVFNFPTYAECYRVAALEAASCLAAMDSSDQVA